MPSVPESSGTSRNRNHTAAPSSARRDRLAVQSQPPRHPAMPRFSHGCEGFARGRLVRRPSDSGGISDMLANIRTVAIQVAGSARPGSRRLRAVVQATGLGPAADLDELVHRVAPHAEAKGSNGALVDLQPCTGLWRLPFGGRDPEGAFCVANRLTTRQSVISLQCTSLERVRAGNRRCSPPDCRSDLRFPQWKVYVS